MRIGITQRVDLIADYEETRALLHKLALESLSESDRHFLIGFNRLEPDWSVYPYQDFPSVKWKLLNGYGIWKYRQGVTNGTIPLTATISPPNA